MKKTFLLFILILSSTCVFAIEENFKPVASSLSASSAIGFNNGHYRGGHCHHNHGYNHNYNRNPFFRRGYGTITGYTPPINYDYNYPHYYTNYSTGPYYGNNNGIGAKIVRFFNPNYNNHYLNSPYNNSYVNGNYNNLNDRAKKYIQFYDGGQQGDSSGQVYNGYGMDGASTSSGGATVTIID